jgi:nucleoside-diphosphate-sugar epimerase
MDLLVLGGTAWLGRSVAREAHARGHRVTCLARGSSGPPPEGAALVTGDRDTPAGYDGLNGAAFDAVVDVSRQPRQVRTALDALSSRVGHWSFVSTCSVYADDLTPGQDESGPLHPAWVGEGEAALEEYGPAKVACEEAVLAREGASCVTRSGLIVGAGDGSDRFGYWPARVDRAVANREPVLVPALDSAVQVLDVDDFATWLVSLAERGTAGVLNAVGDVLTFGDVIAACGAASGGTPDLLERSDEWLTEHSVEPWSGPESLPLWLPRATYGGFMRRRNHAGKTAGLVLRPLADTVEAALGWERELGLERERRAGLSPLREAELSQISGD